MAQIFSDENRRVTPVALITQGCSAVVIDTTAGGSHQLAAGTLGTISVQVDTVLMFSASATTPATFGLILAGGAQYDFGLDETPMYLHYEAAGGTMRLFLYT